MERLFNYTGEELKAKGGLITAEEIMRQPALWRKTVNYIEENQVRIDAFIKSKLEIPNLRIILTGAGSSAFVGECVSPYLMTKTSRCVEAIPTTDIVSNPYNYLTSGTPTLLISYARSGNSPESLAALELANEIVDEVYHIVLTCNPEGALAVQNAGKDNVLLLQMDALSNDQGFAMTGSYTSMLLSTALIFSMDQLNENKAIVESVCKDGEHFLAEGYTQLSDLVEESFDRLFYLGSGALTGLARESALKMLELTAGKIMTSFDSALSFRHGPKSAVTEDSCIMCFISTNPYTRLYDTDLLNELLRDQKCKRVVAISGGSQSLERVDSKEGIFTQSVENLEVDDVFISLNYILVAQVYSLLKSLQFGIAPDNPSPDGMVNRVVKGVNIYPFKH